MRKSKVGSRPNEFKYGMGLYGVAWPEGDYYFVCGGGGHGLKPRIVWAQYKNGKCSDQLGEYSTGSDTPMRMAICPWGTSLLVGNANGGLRRLQIGTESYYSKVPRLVDVSASFMEALSGLSAEIGTMTYNSRGNLLAIGFKEREVKESTGEFRKLPGLIKIIGYPSMRGLLELTLDDPEVKDADFCHLPLPQHEQQQHEQQGFELLATVGGHGVCQVWKLQQSGAQVVAKLDLPKGFPGKAKFNRCRFGRSSRSSKANGNNTDDIVLYTQINSRTSNKSCVCYLAVYGPPAEGLTSGKPWQCLKSAVAHSQHLGSCMDISKYGEWIAYGFSEGGLRVYDARTLQLYKEDEASIAFVTSAVFNADNTAVIAVGGDANCFVMELQERPKGMFGLILFLLLLAAAAIAIMHFWQHPEQLPYQLLQQLQQWSTQPDHPVTQACSAGSSWEKVPLQQPVCSWVQKAASVLPGPEYVHDEL